MVTPKKSLPRLKLALSVGCSTVMLGACVSTSTFLHVLKNSMIEKKKKTRDSLLLI